MSMNYVGSISILDRGDGPAQAIIDKNKRSVAQRLADETKDELEKVMHRVEDIYVSYEQSTQDMFLTHGANVEYIEDIKELEEILTDELKKKKYEQKVTVFIVGFENMSNQRLRLIQQVNEFFMDATKPAEDEPLFSPSPDINIEEIGHSIEETLDSADRLTDRLGELNSQMVDWLTNFAINKASTKGKKKMEKALDKAKDDLSGLSEKLLKLQSEMEVKEEKVQQLLKQLEIKTSDTQKYRTAAEAAKKSIQEFEETTLRNKEAMQKKDKEIRELNSKLSMLELEVGQSDYVSKMSSERNQEKNGELKPEDLKKKLAELQDLVDNSKASFFEAQRDWQKLHDQQVTALSNAHKEEMAELKAGFEEELKKYKDEITEAESRVYEAEKAAILAASQADKLRQNLVELQLRGTSAESKVVTEPDSQEDDASQQGPSTTKTVRESRPSTKSSKQSAVPPPKQKSPVKPPTTINKSPGKVKETAESSIQDEGGDHSSAHVETRQSKRNKSSLDPVPETDANVQFDNKFELADESSWGSVPKDQILGRFAQYRQLSQQRISELEEQLTLTLAKTQRKVNTLKSQFQEHKSKWEAERNVLIEQVEQAQKLQTEAEKEADDAMTQLEEFINEQEKLEEEEEGKRTVITRKISQPLPKVVTPPPKQVSPPPQVVTEGTEQELSNLMQQTDDAKSQRQKSGSSSHISSADLEGDIAPWLLSRGKSRKTRLESAASSQSEEEVEEYKRRSSLSKSSFHSKSEKIVSELSKLTDPNESDEDRALESDSEPFSRRMTQSRKSLKSRRTSQGESRMRSSRGSLQLEGAESEISQFQDDGKISGGGKSQLSNRDKSQMSARDKSQLSARDPSQLSTRDKSRVSERGKSKMSSRDKSLLSEAEGGVPSQQDTSSQDEAEHDPISKAPSRRSSHSNINLKESRQSTKHSLRKSHLSDKSRVSDKQSRQSTHFSFRPNVDDGSEEDGEIEEEINQDSRVTRNHSKVTSRKTTMSARSEEEMMGLVGDEDYEDDFEENEDQGRRGPGFEFEDKMASRARSLPIGQHLLEDVDLSRNVDSAPDKMRRRGSVREGRRNSEAEARITSGAMSAPPAVEPEESPQPKKEEIRKLSGVRSPLGSPRPQDSGTHPHKTHSHHKYALPIQEISEASSHESGRSRHGSVHTPESGHKDAWLTPRVTPAQGRVILSTTPREGVMRDLPPSQESAVDNVKTMLEEENLSSMQQRTLESVRSALQKISDDPVLTDVQLERTLTIISLASQLTEESLQLGVLPDTMFEQFADINSRAMSDLGISEDDFRVSETPNPPMELLRPLTRDSLNTRDEPSSMMTFLQELSYTSLHPLPPLHGYLGSSQSQRLHPHRSGLSTRGSQKGIRRDMTFATMATGGSSIRDTFTASSKDSMRFILGGGKATDSMIARHGRADTELDILMMDSEVSSRRGMCDAQTQTDPEFGTELTEDELRMTSAQSRASLRYQFKNRLEESRNAAEERRSKSPVISVPSQRSIDDQLIEDDDFPIPDDIKEEVEMEDRGTSPPPDLRRQSTAMSRKLVDHPVVGEYLKAYEGVLSFKENLSRIMQDREFLQASELLQELDSVTFDMNSKVQPQLESMTKNIYYTLEEIMSVLGSMLYIEREPLVSSLNGMLVSRDQTRNTLQNRERSADSGRGQTATRGSNQSFSTRVPQSASSENLAFKELQQNYEKLQQQLNEESRKHEEQMRHNTVVMMEMQDTINELQRELTALGKASSRSRPPSEGVGQQQTPESAIMFTRLDSERNAKIMKRAVNDERLDTNKYKDAVTTMDEYVSLPAKRLGHLVRKYVHHSRMKDIEENVKKSKSLDENVFEILDKMEALQNKRAKRWADKMDDMGSERMRLANLLMETLDSIEQESGIFLIKPMYSYRGSPLDADYTQLLEEIKERYAGKLTRPTRPHHRTVSPSREMSSFAPAPTPASNIRGITRQLHQNLDPPQQPLFRREIPRPLEGDETGLMGSSALNYNTAVQRQTWNMSTSLVRGDPSDPMNSMNTPRILELDINRMLIGQNTISTKYGSPGLTDDRLINASQNNLRSYVTVNRPTNTNRPRSFTGSKDVPTTTPVSRAVTNSAGNKRVRLSDSEMSTRRSMSNTPPLPPISGQDVTEQGPFKEPPRSPPGSSLRGSPTPQPHVREMISPLK
ncbi:uro-adherence factor A isoform X6 [Magallana gigas]|uniref:uro-adherence factor A isoform X6 n=1 Tax=Magallana gigas TaxID=29159 RepID=UPI0033426027